MKKIIGLGIAVAVIIALVTTGTWAFFSDTEKSEDNTFTAGIIDLVLTPDGKVVKTEAGLEDLKPCETGYLTITLTAAEGSNPMHVWKHIVDIDPATDRDENGIVEPEQEWYTANPTQAPKNDIDRYIHFDMEVNTVEVIAESDGWLLSDNQDDTAGFDPAPIDAYAYNGVTCKWIYLGILDPTGLYLDSVDEMIIVESFHMDETVGNWAQSDQLTFTEEFYAEQLGGPGIESPDEELPGYERP